MSKVYEEPDKQESDIPPKKKQTKEDKEFEELKWNLPVIGNLHFPVCSSLTIKLFASVYLQLQRI
jgi:hypothetical protein